VLTNLCQNASFLFSIKIKTINFSGSDEDALLCGNNQEFGNLTRQGKKEKYPPGSCKLPNRQDIRFINFIFGEEYEAGSFVNNGEYIEIACEKGTRMNISDSFDLSIYCNNSRWSRRWQDFPECQSEKTC
jgi:hypothetical protein